MPKTDRCILSVQIKNMFFCLPCAHFVVFENTGGFDV